MFTASKSAKGGRLSFVRQSNTWLQVGADFKTDSKSVKHISYTIQVEPKEVNFEIDTVSLILLKRESNWKTLLNNDIAKYRKNSVTVRYCSYNSWVVSYRALQCYYAITIQK